MSKIEWKHTRICAHDIEYNFRNDMDITESSEEHIQNMIVEGYTSGELCEYDNETDTEIRGWWRIS